jgi:hypothetical protein
VFFTAWSQEYKTVVPGGHGLSPNSLPISDVVRYLSDDVRLVLDLAI